MRFMRQKHYNSENLSSEPTQLPKDLKSSLKQIKTLDNFAETVYINIVVRLKGGIVLFNVTVA